MFKKKRGINLPYNKQGLIYFTCVNVKELPEKIQQKILNLCIEVGGEYYQALYEAVTTGGDICRIAMKYYISDSTLCRLRKEFYEKW